MRKLGITEKLAPVHSDIRGEIYVESLKMIAQGIDVLKLNTGNPATFGFPMPESVRKALLENADKAVGYCDFRGMMSAREAIVEYHLGKGFKDITVNDVFIGNGVSELATDTLMALLNYGDEILIPTPSYSLWTNSAYMAGAKPVFYRCDEENEWNPDLEDLKSKITPKTRAVLVINPNNPTGSVYSKETLEAIIKIARENDLVILSDEIYDRLLMPGVTHVSTAALAPDMPVITFNGLSKSHIICGFRCGWMVISGPRDVLDGFVQGVTRQTAMRLCGNALTQLVIPAALADDASTKAMYAPGGRLYEQSKATMDGIAKIDGLTCVPNKAAFYVFPKLDVKKFNITNDKKFCMDLLHAKHIMMVAGSGF
ncbi:MAG: aminotransferase class I/II-fold pyridoxal phosphate-dependent enzyme, partial [Mailhella sp.]|nr:aminotransferase class I/II-fold pyridoxal phosphate-dependent enzyme [Mailhella sp.]